MVLKSRGPFPVKTDSLGEGDALETRGRDLLAIGNA